MFILFYHSDMRVGSVSLGVYDSIENVHIAVENFVEKSFKDDETKNKLQKCLKQRMYYMRVELNKEPVYRFGE